MQKLQAIIWVLLASLLTFSLMSLASAGAVPDFALSAQSTQLQYYLPQGTVFNGSVSTSGAVRVWVSDPNGLQIVNLGLIDKQSNFGFVAGQMGNYTVNFENDLPPPVQVSFAYTTNPDLSSTNSATGIPTTLLPIFIIIAVVGSLLVFFVLHKKKTA